MSNPALDAHRVRASEAADILFNVATILELGEGEPYRVGAYRRAARLLLSGAPDQDTVEAIMALPLGLPLRQKIVGLVKDGMGR